MKKEFALKKIERTINQKLPTESQQVKDYFKETIYDFFFSLEQDNDNYTSTENLRYALEVNLIDEFESLLKEAREY